MKTINKIIVTPKDEEAFMKASKFDPNVRFVDFNPIPKDKGITAELNQTEDDINFDPNSGAFIKLNRRS